MNFSEKVNLLEQKVEDEELPKRWSEGGENGHQISFGGHGNILKLAYGDGRTILQIC